MCPFLASTLDLGWLDFGWVVWMLPGRIHGWEILGDAQMGMRATAAGDRTRELGRARLGLSIFSPFQTRIKIN